MLDDYELTGSKWVVQTQFASESFVIGVGETDSIVGSWKIPAEVGAVGAGGAPFDTSYWTPDADEIEVRSCYFDDEYIFGEDGSFTNEFQDATWIEEWQGGSNACDVPVAPHDGSATATYSYSAGAQSLALSGTGAYIGIPKAVNGAEIESPDQAPDQIQYNAYRNGDGSLSLTIQSQSDPVVWWNYKLVRSVDVDDGAYFVIDPDKPVMSVGFEDEPPRSQSLVTDAMSIPFTAEEIVGEWGLNAAVPGRYAPVLPMTIASGSNI